MPNTKIRPTTRTKMAQQIVDDLDAGAGPSVLCFYTAPQPDGPLAAITTQVKLCELICTDPSATITNGVITFGAIAQDPAANATGTAAWARHFDSDGNAVVDHDITNDAGTGAIKISNTAIVADGIVSMTSLTIAIGGA